MVKNLLKINSGLTIILPLRIQTQSTKVIRPTLKQFTCVTEYNGNSDSNFNDNVEFIDVDITCNKLNIRLLDNDSITCIKKRRILKTEDIANEPPKVKATGGKKISVKEIGKKSSKTSVPIFVFVSKSPPDIQALLINTNIVILRLHLF